MKSGWPTLKNYVKTGGVYTKKMVKAAVTGKKG